MKFIFFNDTGRVVSIHTATFSHGCQGEGESIQPLEERTFILPENTYPWFKLWDYGTKNGLSILISPKMLDGSEPKFDFFNDSKRTVSIHPATLIHGCVGDNTNVQPLEIRTFTLPEHSYPWVKMWDYGIERGLSLLVSPRTVE